MLKMGELALRLGGAVSVYFLKVYHRSIYNVVVSKALVLKYRSSHRGVV